MNKNILRKKAKEIRKTLNIEKISADIAIQIRQNSIYKNSNNIMLYYPTKYEINLLSLTDDKKNFYLPRVNGQNMEVCPFSKSLVKSDLGIPEPKTKAINPSIIELIIVPALMCDKNGYRLGYGKGYYDRFLENLKCYTISAVAKELFVEKLPTEKFDIPVKEVLISRI